jgi:hypothetical protein
MNPRTVTRTLEADLEPEAILDILSDPKGIPEWAPAFADTIEPDGSNGWRVKKGSDTFNVQVITARASGTVDILRDMGPGKRGGAYCRVTPRPGGGSVLLINVPIAPGAKEEEIASVLAQELATLVKLSQRR